MGSSAFFLEHQVHRFTTRHLFSPIISLFKDGEQLIDNIRMAFPDIVTSGFQNLVQTCDPIAAVGAALQEMAVAAIKNEAISSAENLLDNVGQLRAYGIRPRDLAVIQGWQRDEYGVFKNRIKGLPLADNSVPKNESQRTYRTLADENPIMFALDRFGYDEAKVEYYGRDETSIHEEQPAHSVLTFSCVNVLPIRKLFNEQFFDWNFALPGHDGFAYHGDFDQELIEQYGRIEAAKLAAYGITDKEGITTNPRLDKIDQALITWMDGDYISDSSSTLGSSEKDYLRNSIILNITGSHKSGTAFAIRQLFHPSVQNRFKALRKKHNIVQARLADIPVQRQRGHLMPVSYNLKACKLEWSGAG